MKSDNTYPPRLIDHLGRRLNYLRVSVTEHCNLRCRYCYGSKRPPLPKRPPMTDDQIVAAAELFARLGVNKVRLTGGEPLFRSSLVKLVRRISRLPGIELVGLTTNGVLLAHNKADRNVGPPLLERLIAAGLHRINISLDSLDRENYRRITGRDCLGKVLEAIETAQQSGAFPRVKVNTVVLRGVNDFEVREMALWALERGIDLRFIEFMPTLGSGWDEESFVSEAETRERLALELRPDDELPDPSATAVYYRSGAYPGRLRFISPVTRSFCSRCNRLRLTASGELMGCLFSWNRIDISPILNGKFGKTEKNDYIGKIIKAPDFRVLPYNKTGACKPEMISVGG